LFFAVTLFVSASLLFVVQPMFAKMALPLLGGTPAVWNTCMVFFQAALLAGYGYAHGATERLGARRHAALHVGLLFLPLLVLPIRIPLGWAPPVEQNPIPWLLALLLVSVGLPFFMLSTITPTLQMWYANTGHPSAKDPYFLYSASNLGSMLALLSYPVLIEPHLRLADQRWVWACGYGLLLVLTLSCAVMLWRSPGVTAQNPSPGTGHNSRSPSSNVDNAAGPTRGQRMRWVALAFVPSSLMLGVTTTLTTDIPAIPLLWVIPLAVYLLSFILVFARKPILTHKSTVQWLPLLILAVTMSIVSKAAPPVWLLVLLDLLTLFVAAMVCHGELANSRPPTKHLTEFYMWMSVGGVLGGLFNALVAPLVFNTVAEFPLVLVLAALLRPRLGPEAQKPHLRWLDFSLPLALAVMLAGLIWGLQAIGLKPGPLLHLLVFGPSLLLCLSFAKRPIRFGLGVGAIMLASMFYTGPYGHLLHAERSFFGVYRIALDPQKKYRLFFHGSTVHGVQSLDAARSREPLSYFYRTGPIGQVFTAFSGADILKQVAIVGLGAGSLACYGEPGQQFTFYEIDPAIERIARDPRYFTFLRDCSPKTDVVLGDARLSLRNAPDRHYGLIVLDAFSSDAVPLHLLTREALKLYLTKLAEGGILAFHISNRYLDLRPVLGNLAGDAGLVCLTQDDTNVSEAETQKGKYPSRWVVMARRQDDLGKLAQDPRWHMLSARAGTRVWTDDFTSIVGIIRWN
jgi:hypothetical protein